MQRLAKLRELFEEQNRPKNDLELIGQAFEFAERVHHGFKRISGADYIEHPLAVAYRLAEMNMPTSIVAAAILHDTIEESNIPEEKTRAELRSSFDPDIASLVEHVTKLDFKNPSSAHRYTGVDRYIENLRKMFVAFASDIRAIIIKFADRIENLRDLEVLPEAKRLRIAFETLEVYAPIARRLGIARFHVELEDMSFKHAMPGEYEKVVRLVGEKYKMRDDYLDRIAAQVKSRLDAAGIHSDIVLQARMKHLFSIYRKLVKYDWDANRIWDLFAIRIIADNAPDCYATLGVVHSMWKPVKDRIKDYIAQPKPNGYRSIHTTVFCDDGEFVEFQIRTKDMHEEAQFGIAAHWRYDEGKNRAKLPTREIDWVQELSSIHKEIESNKDFLETLEHMKIDALRDRIFVYTPKGDVIDLPEDATPIDFAYAIHSDIGNKAVAAEVNNKNAPLNCFAPERRHRAHNNRQEPQRPIGRLAQVREDPYRARTHQIIVAIGIQRLHKEHGAGREEEIAINKGQAFSKGLSFNTVFFQRAPSFFMSSRYSSSE
jgi:GTP diphosphokinase / guanosine-3',5'-bis(diphosphate) 3'-diphosphatase